MGYLVLLGELQGVGPSRRRWRQSCCCPYCAGAGPGLRGSLTAPVGASSKQLSGNPGPSWAPCQGQDRKPRGDSDSGCQMSLAEKPRRPVCTSDWPPQTHMLPQDPCKVGPVSGAAAPHFRLISSLKSPRLGLCVWVIVCVSVGWYVSVWMGMCVWSVCTFMGLCVCWSIYAYERSVCVWRVGLCVCVYLSICLCEGCVHLSLCVSVCLCVGLSLRFCTSVEGLSIPVSAPWGMCGGPEPQIGDTSRRTLGPQVRPLYGVQLASSPERGIDCPSSVPGN